MKNIKICLVGLLLLSFQSNAYVVYGSRQAIQALDIKGGFGYELESILPESDIISSDILSDKEFIRKVKTKYPVNYIDDYYVLTDKNYKIYSIYGTTTYENAERCHDYLYVHQAGLKREFPALRASSDKPYTYIAGNASRSVRVTCAGKEGKKLVIEYRAAFPALYDIFG